MPASFFADVGVQDAVMVVTVFDPSEAAAMQRSSSSGTGTSASPPLEVKAAMNINVASLAGDRISVNGLQEPISIAMPVNASDGMECAYWDEQQLVWSTEGMLPAGSSADGLLVCKTTHLSLFGAIIRGFISSFECSQVGLLNAEAISRIFEGDWWLSTGAIMLWILVAVELGGIALGFSLDIGRRRQGKCHDEFFLMPASDSGEEDPPEVEDNSKNEKGEGAEKEDQEQDEGEQAKRGAIAAVGCCLISACCCIIAWARESSALRDALDDILGNYIQNFSEIRDTLESLWEGLGCCGDVTGVEEGTCTFLVVNRMMKTLVLSNARRQASASLLVADDDLAFVLEDEDVNDVLVSRKEYNRSPTDSSPAAIVAVAPGQAEMLEADASAVGSQAPGGDAQILVRQRSNKAVGREAVWGKLHDRANEHVQRHMLETGSWRSLHCAVFRLFLVQNPFGAAMVYSAFMPSSLRFFLFSLEQIGALMLGTVFFSSTGGVQGRRQRANCGGSDVQLGEQMGRLAAIGLASLFIAGIPVSILGSLHQRSIKRVPYEGSEAWQKQLRAWRIQDRIIWCMGSLYAGFSLFFMCLFLSNVSDQDSLNWAISSLIALGQCIILVPLCMSLFVPLFAAVTLRIVSCMAKQPKEELIRQRHLEHMSSGNAMLPIVSI